jgi:hypothetical protein
MSFKDNSNNYGFCHSPFANIYGKDGGVTTPSQAVYNGFYYVSSTTNSLSGADSNPFMQYHTSNNDFRILTTGYDGAESSPLWVQQIATDFRTEHVYVRRKENGAWKDWKKLAFSSDIPSTSSFFAKAGGDITGHVYLTGSSASSSTGNTSQLVFGKSSAQHVVLSSNAQALVINPTTSSTTNQNFARG